MLCGRYVVRKGEKVIFLEERKQFTMYESMFKALVRIRKKQDRADAYDAICGYALYGLEPDMETMPDPAAIAFELIRPVLDSARKKAETGKQGGSKPKANRKQNGSKEEAVPKQTEREKEGEIEKENENEIENEIEIEGEIENKAEAATEKRQRAEGRAFTSFWENYPNKTDREEAWSAWKELSPDGKTVAQIRESLAAWKQSRQWLDDNGQFIPTAARWLRKRRWECTPAPGKQPIPKGASGELGQAELEAIQRVLQEG